MTHIILILLHVPKDYYNPKINLNVWVELLYVISTVGLGITTVLMLYYNINFKHINFKRYLKELYKGLEIKHRYEQASIFIKRSRCASAKNKRERSLFDLGYSHSGNTNVITVDSDSVDSQGNSKEERDSSYCQNYKILHSISQ